MKALGLDIGTTTISAVVTVDGVVQTSVTMQNASFISTSNSWEKIQDPAIIKMTALQAVEALLSEHSDVMCIGVTGQMHGIVYLDELGSPVSPLYTWQDGRGDLSYGDGESYASWLGRLTGYSVATGYGMVTHAYNLKNGIVPKNARVFCTIHDYIAMVLAGQTKPVVEASDAASFGVFDLERRVFDVDALSSADIDIEMLPNLASEQLLGFYKGEIPVYTAIGDNQASFLGATGGNLQAMLVNVGTGSQFSVHVKEYMQRSGLETRPFPGDGYLLVGASLCGGRAYAILENFFRTVVQMATGNTPTSCYEMMNTLLEIGDKPVDLPVISPLFQGTRQNPSLRGIIDGISTENFTPRHMTWAMLEGMVSELYEMYQVSGQCKANRLLIGSGNGLRKNTHLQHCFEERFEQKLTMSVCNEEAATGAALYASQQEKFRRKEM